MQLIRASLSLYLSFSLSLSLLIVLMCATYTLCLISSLGKWAIVLDDVEFVKHSRNILDEPFEQLHPHEQIVGEMDEFYLPPILYSIASVTHSVEFRRGEMFLNCQHPLTEEGIEPPVVVDEKPWDRFLPQTEEVIVYDTY